MRNDLALVFRLLVETPDEPTRRTIADTLIRVLDPMMPTTDAHPILHTAADDTSPAAIDIEQPKPRRTMSKTARRAISRAQRRRWKKQHAAAKNNHASKGKD